MGIYLLRLLAHGHEFEDERRHEMSEETGSAYGLFHLQFGVKDSLIMTV